MNHIKISLILYFLLPSSLPAQVPNADFELWESASPFYLAEYPQQWNAPPDMGEQHWPVEKAGNPNMGQYAVKVKNNLPTPSAVGGAPGFLETTFVPSSRHFRLSMEVKYDSIVPPGRARIVVGGAGFYVTHWVDETIREEMETIQIEVELPQALNLAVFHIEARGVYNPDYGNPPFNGGYDGYAEIVVDNIWYENVTSAGEAFKEDEVTIFPNPASEAVWVKTQTGESIQFITILNPAGEIILQKSPGRQDYLLDVQVLPAGTYWMEIALPGRRLIRQWAKM